MITLPTYRPEADALVDTDYFDATEVGGMLHVHANTVRRHHREGRWPCLRIGHTAYMSAAMIGEAVETMTQRVGSIPEDPPRIGTPVAAAEIEGIR